MNYKNELNEKQYSAVITQKQHVRVVAGAGSGKTRVLTYRIAYLMDAMKVYPDEILAFTFTNKVAKEMHDRVVLLLGEDIPNLKIKTFHSFAAYFLRLEIHNINFPSAFTILDEDDKDHIIKDCVTKLGYSKRHEIVNFATNYISNKKLKEQYPSDISEPTKEEFKYEKDCLKIYQMYEETKNRMYALDFDDLLLYTIYILKTFPRIQHKWKSKFRHILVDEFQDTNDTEFKMLMLLKDEDTSLYVVGDPDQTIYTWRGANQDIILKLDSTFKDIETIILNQNYRSTQKILNSANSLISHNRFRIKKDLFTNLLGGDAIICKGFNSYSSEAEYVVKEILRLKNSGRYAYKDIVILYRSNYVSLDFEKALMSSHIPYKIFGGLKFYQRKEIKDVLAYMRLLVNIRDDSAFERAINVPKRGIGEVSIAKLKNEASKEHLSLYEYVQKVDFEHSEVSKKVLNTLKVVVERIDMTRKDVEKNQEAYSSLIENMILDLNYYDEVLKLEDGEERMENIKALFQDMRNYLRKNPDSSFADYLQETALLSSQDEIVDTESVTLMTVHTAKGLEYSVVFVVRYNETVFPSYRSMESGGYDSLEEERRLAYVAMTRAKEKLYITFNSSYSYSAKDFLSPSPFIKEANIEINSYNQTKKSYHFDDDGFFINQDNVYEPPKVFVDKNKFYKEEIPPATNNINWKVGDQVMHKNFGLGVVTKVEGDGIIEVDFEKEGIKSLVGNHRFLSKVEKS